MGIRIKSGQKKIGKVMAGKPALIQFSSSSSLIYHPLTSCELPALAMSFGRSSRNKARTRRAAIRSVNRGKNRFMNTMSLP
jgi:hypothetical protein